MSSKTFFSIEFDFHASPQLLYQYLSTPSGLSEWFADNVNSRGEVFKFIWDGTEEQAKLVAKKSGEGGKVRRFEVEEDRNDMFIDIKIQVEAITKDFYIIDTDFEEEDVNHFHY